MSFLRLSQSRAAVFEPRHCPLTKPASMRRTEAGSAHVSGDGRITCDIDSDQGTGQAGAFDTVIATAKLDPPDWEAFPRDLRPRTHSFRRRAPCPTREEEVLPPLQDRLTDQRVTHLTAFE